MTDSTILQPEGLEQRYERYKEKIKHFTIMNDIFMRNVLKEISRSEERRVGKECRSRWSPYH